MNDEVNNQHIESKRCIHGFYVDACLLCPSSTVKMTMTGAREAFEQFIKNSPNYNRLVFIHGERLFIFEDGQYKNLHVQLAWEVWQEQQKKIDELQKRVDAALKMISINRGFAWGTESINQLEQALKYGEHE